MGKPATCVVIGLFLLLASCAQADPNSPSGKRHAAFEKIGKASKALSTALDTASPDFAAAKEPVAVLRTEAALLPSLFPRGSGPGSNQPTDALAVIWTKPAEFSKKMSALEKAVVTLDTAVSKGDGAAARAANAALGTTCKDCHSEFRK